MSDEGVGDGAELAGRGRLGDIESGKAGCADSKTAQARIRRRSRIIHLRIDDFPAVVHCYDNGHLSKTHAPVSRNRKMRWPLQQKICRRELR